MAKHMQRYCRRVNGATAVSLSFFPYAVRSANLAFPLDSR